MRQSLLLKLGMLAGTVAVVFWIGWAVPATQDQRATAVPTTSQADLTAPVDRSVVAQPAAPLAASQKPMARERVRPVSGPLDLNRATAEELESLPGIGPVLATRIVEYRKAKGVFHTVEQLKQVKGIGTKKFERVRLLLNVTPAATPVQRTKGAA